MCCMYLFIDLVLFFIYESFVFVFLHIDFFSFHNLMKIDQYEQVMLLLCLLLPDFL